MSTPSKPFAAVRWADGIGAARVIERRTERVEISAENRAGRWWAVRETVNTATGKSTAVKEQDCGTKAEALRVAETWALAYQRDKQRLLAGLRERRAVESKTGVAGAAVEQFRREFPAVAQLLGQRAAAVADFEAALRVDTVEQTGRAPASARKTRAVAAALRRWGRRRHRAGDAAVDLALLLGWIAEDYHLLTAAELAADINERFSTHHSPASIKKRRDRLGLLTSRPTGPRPVS